MRYILVFFLSGPLLAQISYDLRELNQTSGPKEQSWGTCWSFASIASMESNILKNHSWESKGKVDLSEYHMDKYSGFSRNGSAEHLQAESYSGQGARFKGSNKDSPEEGLIVHLGGDYRMATSYLTNIGGAVEETKTPTISSSHLDQKIFGDQSDEGVLLKNNYNYYLPESVEWLTYGSFEENIKRIKTNIVKHGSVGSSQRMRDEPVEVFLSGEEVHSYFGNEPPTHAVNIIGWDDERVVVPLRPGVWFMQDSDHANELNEHIGYFITPFADEYTGQDPLFGGVSFRNVKKRSFYKIHSFSLHGWQYEFRADKVSNIYELADEVPSEVGVYTVVPNDTIVALISDLEGNIICHSEKMFKENPGFYLLSLTCDIETMRSKKYRVEIITNSKQYAFDGTKVYKPLLSSSKLPKWGESVKVSSLSGYDESFYFKNGRWLDFKTYRWKTERQYGININKSGTTNFSINLYTNKR